jgi:uncharacterized protein
VSYLIPSIDVKEADVLVIGAGPAGIAAATACLSHNAKVILVDSGPPIDKRDHKNHQQICSGVGGAGLFSDGKFSFFPSATHLWTLIDQKCLVRSYAWFAETVRSFGIDAPPFPDMSTIITKAPDQRHDQLFVKSYPSSYMSYEHRVELTHFLMIPLQDALVTDTDITAIRFNADSDCFICTAHTKEHSQPTYLSVKSVIFAGGRFGPIQFRSIFSDVRMVYRKLEVGLRLQQASPDFFLKDDFRLDPKVIIIPSDPRYTWRTFCCCRNGELMVTYCRGITSLSGRSDCSSCGQSNIGFHVRVSEEAMGTELWPNILRTVQNLPQSTFTLELLSHFLSATLSIASTAKSRHVEILGSRVAKLIAEGLDFLRQEYALLHNTDTYVAAPALEGVAFYPDVDGRLRCSSFPLWVAGDATGLFRGLSAAMISGYYVGIQALVFLKVQI